MIPLLVFLLAGAIVYLATIQAAFSVVMRLSLRLLAERNGRTGALAEYLDDPVRLFVPIRLLIGISLTVTAVLLAREIGVVNAYRLGLTMVAMASFILTFEQVLPLLIVRRDPERVLELLLPSFRVVARPVEFVTQALRGFVRLPRREPAAQPGAGPTTDSAADQVTQAYLEAGEEQGLIERDERRLLQSIVDFGDRLVREVMTPRPDIVAIRSDATLDQLRALFREQEYSRIPVYQENLDNILGFVFVKDLILLTSPSDEPPITSLMRPAYFVPETKRVPELLKEFQRHQVQLAIVVDEYGGTAGLVSIEDLLEEIVGEIRDEYDVESEPILDEGNGVFLVNGKVDVEKVAERLNVPIERAGFETIGGYLLSQLGRVPSVGETFELDGLSVEVLEAERRRVTKVRLRRREAVGQASSSQS